MQERSSAVSRGRLFYLRGLQRQSGASLPNVKQAVRDLSDNADDERGAQVRYEIDRRVKAGQQQQLAELANEDSTVVVGSTQQRECTSFAQVSVLCSWCLNYCVFRMGSGSWMRPGLLSADHDRQLAFGRLTTVNPRPGHRSKRRLQGSDAVVVMLSALWRLRSIPTSSIDPIPASCADTTQHTYQEFPHEHRRQASRIDREWETFNVIISVRGTSYIDSAATTPVPRLVSAGPFRPPVIPPTIRALVVGPKASSELFDLSIAFGLTLEKLGLVGEGELDCDKMASP